MLPFLILLFMSVMGLSYNLTLIPEKIADGKYRRIRDIPGSKTVLIAVAWGIVTSVFPSLSVFGEIDMGTVLVFAWATGMVFVRSAFFDILDMQGDRVVGKDTIPILLGEKQTIGLLKCVLVIITLILLLSSAFQVVSQLGLTLAVCLF